jgi:hypothetical protein
LPHTSITTNLRRLAAAINTVFWTKRIRFNVERSPMHTHAKGSGVGTSPTGIHKVVGQAIEFQVVAWRPKIFKGQPRAKPRGGMFLVAELIHIRDMRRKGERLSFW